MSIVAQASVRMETKIVGLEEGMEIGAQAGKLIGKGRGTTPITSTSQLDHTMTIADQAMLKGQIIIRVPDSGREVRGVVGVTFMDGKLTVLDQMSSRMR